MRILLVEDQASLARQVAEKIQRSGYDVDQVETIEEALRALDSCAYSLALLDRRLPDGDGVSLVPRIRKMRPETRILMLTALDAIDDRIEGLDAGADDYLTKPFNLDEMIARIRANLRKHGASPAPAVMIGAMSSREKGGVRQGSFPAAVASRADPARDSRQTRELRRIARGVERGALWIWRGGSGSRADLAGFEAAHATRRLRCASRNLFSARSGLYSAGDEGE